MIDGVTPVMTKERVFPEALPPATEMVCEPAEATAEAAICTVNVALFTKAVGRGVESQRTTESSANPDPATVSVKSGLPTGTLAGWRLEMTLGW
jgi:hypothetical protein